jgi:hypothetical protein
MHLTLINFFERQDNAVEPNRAAAAVVLPMLERALSAALDVTLCINEPEYLGGAAPEARIRANLLHGAWASLVTASRLALFGDDVLALTSIRLALEDASHAEFFRHRPELAEEWDSAGQITDLTERRRQIEAFSRRHHVRTFLERQDDPLRTRSRLFHVLSTYGVHTNPVTTSLRLSVPPDQGANLGFASVGKREATQLVVTYALHVAVYVVSELVESFGPYIGSDEGLLNDCRSIMGDYETLKSVLPAQLSMTR